MGLRAYAAGIFNFASRSKFLNPCEKTFDSFEVENISAALKFFYSFITFVAVEPTFQSAATRYGDKCLAKRAFSDLFFRVTQNPLSAPVRARP
jgi:hypothetical protein